LWKDQTVPATSFDQVGKDRKGYSWALLVTVLAFRLKISRQGLPNRNIPRLKPLSAGSSLQALIHEDIGNG
jgi:hypothetical protein